MCLYFSPKNTVLNNCLLAFILSALIVSGSHAVLNIFIKPDSDTDSITDLCSFRNSAFILMRTPSTRSLTRWTSTKTDKWNWMSSYRYEPLEPVITAIYRLQVILVSLQFSSRICSCRCENLKNKIACYLHVSTSMFCHKPTGSP